MAMAMAGAILFFPFYFLLVFLFGFSFMERGFSAVVNNRYNLSPWMERCIGPDWKRGKHGSCKGGSSGYGHWTNLDPSTDRAGQYEQDGWTGQGAAWDAVGQDGELG